MQYTQDNNEGYPLDCWDAGSGLSTAAAQASGASFMYAIYPYVKSYGVYKCPDDSTTNGSSYLDNNDVFGNLAACVAPASTALILEGDWQGQNVNPPTNSDWYQGDPYHGINPVTGDDYTIADFGGRAFPRHVGNTLMEVAFADGHVKAVGPLNNTSEANLARSLNVALPYASPDNLPQGAQGSMCEEDTPACTTDPSIGGNPYWGFLGPWA